MAKRLRRVPRTPGQPKASDFWRTPRELGHGARPFDVEWARSLVRQCRDAGVACFVKQLGSDPYEAYSDGSRFADVKLNDRKGGDISEWSAELCVRQFP